jgi:phosphoglycolate phosphatase
MGLEGILFDKDGTLIDFDATWGPTAYEVMCALSRGDARKLCALMQVSHYVEAERRLLPSSPLVAGSSATYGPLWAEALGRRPGLELYREMDELFSLFALRRLAPIAEPATVAALLKHRGLHLGIATNDAEASAKAQADALGLSPYLAYVAGYDSGYGGKPGPGMVLGFAEKCGIGLDRVAVVGDSLHDLYAARAAGAMAIAVLSGPLREGARSELAPHADHVIGSIVELPSLVDGLRASASASRKPAL